MQFICRGVGNRSWGFFRGARRALLCLALLAAQPALAERSDSLSAEVAYERGARALRTGDTEAALGYLARAQELEPESLQTLSLYGRTLLIAGRPAEAMTLFNKYADLNPQSTELNYYRGIASYQLGNWSKTIVYLRPEIGERPEEGLIRLYMGIAYQETGRPDKARRMLEEAAQVDPTLRAAALYRLGVMALEQKNTSEAKEFLGEVEQIAAGSALARSARNYLDQLDSGLYRPVAAYATFTGGYDSNVTLQTGEELTAEPGIQSGVGQGTFGVSGLLVDSNFFDLRLGASGFASIHGSNPANNYDQALARGFLIGSVEITEKMRFNLGYSYEYVWLNYSKFRATNDVDVSLRFVPFGNFVTNLTYEAQIRDYLLPLPKSLAALNRDGNVQAAGMSQLWYTPDWFGWGKNFLGAGFQFRHEESDGLEYDSDSYNARIRAGFALPWSMYWTASAGYEWRMFEHSSCFYDYPARATCAAPPAGVRYPKRQDKFVRFFTNLRVGISQEVYVDLSYRYSKRMSNVHFYRYHRNLVEFGVTYRY